MGSPMTEVFVTQRIFGAVCLVLAAALFILHAAAFDADAARFGGGKSFGGKQSYSRSAPAPRSAQQDAYSRQTNQAANPAAAAARPGLGSGFRGMLGGLLAGTLLGSLLFGGGFGGFGMMDILLVAVMAFVGLKLFRMFMNRRTAEATVGGSSHPAGDGRSAGANLWQKLQGTDSAAGPASSGPGAFGAGAFGAGPSGGAPAEDQGADIRLAGFDQEDFLRGAKVLYTRLQESWDRRDLADIATFTTPAILNEIKAQADAAPASSKTEIMLVNASMVSAASEDGEDVATVYFDALLREDQNAQTPSQVRELWHFTRPSGSTQSWRLDGIQQVE